MMNAFENTKKRMASRIEALPLKTAVGLSGLVGRQIEGEFEAREMAGVAGLEPVTSAVTGQRSNQLSYTPRMGHAKVEKPPWQVNGQLGSVLIYCGGGL